jgi:hypothetical protein
MTIRSTAAGSDAQGHERNGEEVTLAQPYSVGDTGDPGTLDRFTICFALHFGHSQSCSLPFIRSHESGKTSAFQDPAIHGTGITFLSRAEHAM